MLPTPSPEFRKLRPHRTIVHIHENRIGSADCARHFTDEPTDVELAIRSETLTLQFSDDF
jgi:hypothetical protein